MVSNRRNVKTPLPVYSASRSTILGYAVDVSPNSLTFQSPTGIVLANYITLWLETTNSSKSKSYIRVGVHSKAPWQKPSAGDDFTELEIDTIASADLVTLQQQVADGQSFS